MMNFNRLKELAKKFGGILVFDGDNPEFIILSYEQYRKMEASKSFEEISDREEETIEKLNREILALKEEIRQRESAELVESAEREESASDSTLFEQ
jgi:hypothetical protein